jgi:hypothetical protein
MSAILFGRIQQKGWKIFILLILLLAPNFLEMSRAATKNPDKPSVLEMRFTGTGSGETGRFTVEDGWKIRWETESSSFKLSAHGSARRPYVGPANEREDVLRYFETMHPIVLANTTETTGTAVHPFGGTFYLKIVADGPWRIDLKTIPDTKDYLDVPYTGAP